MHFHEIVLLTYVNLHIDAAEIVGKESHSLDYYHSDCTVIYFNVQDVYENVSLLYCNTIVSLEVSSLESGELRYKFFM